MFVFGGVLMLASVKTCSFASPVNLKIANPFFDATSRDFSGSPAFTWNLIIPYLVAHGS